MFKKLLFIVLLLSFCLVAFATCSSAYVGDIPDNIPSSNMYGGATPFVSSVVYQYSDADKLAVGGTGITNYATDNVNTFSYGDFTAGSGVNVHISTSPTSTGGRAYSVYDNYSSSNPEYTLVNYRGFFPSEVSDLRVRVNGSSGSSISVRNDSAGFVSIPFGIERREAYVEDTDLVYFSTVYVTIAFRSYDVIDNSASKPFFSGYFNANIYNPFEEGDYITVSFGAFNLNEFILQINSLANDYLLRLDVDSSVYTIGDAGTPYFYNCSSIIFNNPDAEFKPFIDTIAIDEGVNVLELSGDLLVQTEFTYVYDEVIEEIDVNIFDWLFDAVQGVLDIQFFGSITFGHILLIVLAIPLLIGILKLIAGG